MVYRLGLLLVLLSSVCLHSQVIDIRDGQSATVWKHSLGPTHAIHTDVQKLDDRYRSFGAVELDVIVGANGRVNEAHAVEGPSELFEEAERIERQRSFIPFTTKDGTIVTAHIRDAVGILPRELWLPEHVSIPPDIDLNTVSFALERTGCLGRCPGYTVTLHGDGRVEYTGGSYVLVPGPHVAHVDVKTVRALLDEFRRADFLSARPRYESDTTDGPSQTIKLRYEGKEWQVYSYVGFSAGLPEVIGSLQEKIDKAAGTERWVAGNSETLQSLKEEHWNFGSHSKENLDLFNSAIEHDRSDLVEVMLAAGIPTDIKTKPAASYDRTEYPVCIATRLEKRLLVKRMAKLNPPSHAVAQACMASAARAGSLVLLNFWIEHGGKPDRPIPEDGWGGEAGNLLADAITSHQPEVVARVLEFPIDRRYLVNTEIPLLFFAAIGSGNDPEQTKKIFELLSSHDFSTSERNKYGETLLFRSDDDLMPHLLTLGIPIDARNNDGETALMHQYSAEAIQRLLDAGADPTLQDKAGVSVEDHVLENCEACKSTIEAAIARRKGKVQ